MVRALDSQSKGPCFKTTGQHNTNSTTDQPKVNSAYHPSEVDQMGSKTSWGNSDKKYFSRTDSVALNPIHKKGP